MIDPRCRYVVDAAGEPSVYIMSDDKLPGGSSRRYASIGQDEAQLFLTLDDRTDDNALVVREVPYDVGSFFAAFKAASDWVNRAADKLEER